MWTFVLLHTVWSLRTTEQNPLFQKRYFHDVITLPLYEEDHVEVVQGIIVELIPFKNNDLELGVLWGPAHGEIS